MKTKGNHAGVPIVGFVGASGSGKTTFVERLVAYFAEAGLRVLCVKHTPHGYDAGAPDTDSARYKRAGAVCSMAHDGSTVSMVVDAPNLSDPEKIAALYAGDVDLIVAEGYKKSGVAKIEVSRAAVSTALLMAGRPELLAVIADYDLQPGVPVFDFRDVAGIATLIESTFGPFDLDESFE